MAEFNLQDFPTSESAKRQLGYVSDGFYETSYVGKWMFQVMGQEYDTARQIVEELPAQMFPETATWGLKYHELKWQLPVRESLSYEERRRLIFQKRDLKSPMTPYRMEQYICNMTGFKTIVSDIQDAGEYEFVPKHPNIFKVTLIGVETIDVKTVREIINGLKQSHTTFIISDRIIIVADHRGMEKAALARINMQMCFPFFHRHGADEEVLQKFGIKNLFHGCRVKNKEAFDVSLISRKNYWTLDGSVCLDGSRKLNAKITEEGL